MKKTIATVISFIVIFAMLATFAGCSDQSKFEGKWAGEFDISDALQAAMEDENPDAAEYMDFSETAPITLIFEFKADNTYSITADKASVDKFVESFRDILEAGLRDALKDELKKQGVSMDVEDALELTGTSMDDLLDEAMEDMEPEDLIKELENEGKYKVDDGKLYLSDSKKNEVDEKVYTTYEFSGEDIKLLKEYGNKDDDDEISKYLFPITLVKQ